MQNGKVLVHHKTDDNVEISLGPKPRKQIQEIMLQKDLKEFKELKMQGTLADLKDVDYLLSQDIFKNPTWSDSLVQFWYKTKHNVEACNYTLSIWYPATSLICSLDSYRLESMAHLSNGCKEFKDYSKRHDKIVGKVAEELKHVSPFVSTNRTIGSALEELHLKDHLKILRPDIVLRNHQKIVPIDVACPYDLFLDELFDRTLNIYLELNYEINKTVKCEVLPFIVGSTRLVHKKCLKTLMSLGIPNRQAKGLCQWCSSNNILFARHIWNVRCRLVKDN